MSGGLRIGLAYDAIYPWVAGGAERRFHEIGRRLADRHRVELIGWQWWDGPARIERDGMTLIGLGPAPDLYGGDGKRTVREAIGFARRLLPHLLRHRYDVVDCSATPYLPLYAAAAATRLRGGRLVATWHEFWGSHWHDYLPHRPVVARAARSLESGARRLGDRTVAVSPFTARAMGRLGHPRTEIVPNGVDVAALRDATPADDGADVLAVGRLIDEKRIDLLLDALAVLDEERGTAPRTAIIGDGPELGRLRERAARLGLDATVRFHGRVTETDLRRHLAAARMVVMTSAREGYGMAVAEAQAAGSVPIVARGPFTAAPDLVRDGIDGLVVDPTPRALAEAIGSLVTDDARRAALSAAAKETGAARSWDLVAERMERVYAGLLAPSGADGRRRRRLGWS